MPKVVSTTEFYKCLDDLRKGGKKGKDAVMKSLAALGEAGSYGEINCVTHTDTIPTQADVEKYNLGDGYRLIVQLVDGKNKTRAFLFAGTHEKADNWLNTHKNYKWVIRNSDGTLDFVQVSVAKPETGTILLLNPDPPPRLPEFPLLKDVREKEWPLLDLAANVREYVQKVTAADWEKKADDIIAYVENLGGGDCACLMVDLFHHAFNGEWEALHRRMELGTGVAHAAQEAEAADAMVSPINSENFITWEDSKELPLDQDWADWMLFLHPAQKTLVMQELNGPARLRGVSGSGKTSVMVHRARYLAKKYNQQVLVVTLTENMRKLLDSLLKSLCGIESAHIKTHTMNSLATHIIRHLHPKGETWYTMATQEKLQDMENEAVHIVRKHPHFAKTPLQKLNDQELKRFVIDEIEYVRGRLPRTEYGIYPTRGFRRSGRIQPLGESGRRICLEAIRYWNQALSVSHTLDYPEIVQTAWDLVSQQGALSDLSKDSPFRPRCVLVDEVQDLSQLDVRLLGHLTAYTGTVAPTPSGGNKAEDATPPVAEPETTQPPFTAVVPQAAVLGYVVLLKNAKGVLNQKGPKYTTKAEADKAALGYPYPPFGLPVVQPVTASSKLPVVIPIAPAEPKKIQLPVKPTVAPNVPAVQPAVTNSLFLVGDGAQAIYKRGFSLSKIGINVVGRSWVMKKNYRNTFEVLRAAYGLIESYEFADIDEDGLQTPLEPDYAPRHGERPFIVHCRSQMEEAGFVAAQIQTLLDRCKLSLGQICVVGPNRTVREAVRMAFDQAKLPCIELSKDADPETNKVKISTIESSKGHEFSTVFIVRLIDGALPLRTTPPEEQHRDAARLYVAMTRARDRLYLSYNTKANAQPSPLLSSIQ